ncbi:hypothetical protein D3C81_839290 [compost metagenome]
MLAVFLDFKQADIRVPGVEAFLLGNLDAVQALNNGEQAAQHFIDREVGAQGFLGHAVALLTEFFAVETAIPALQIRAALFGGVSLELLQILGSERLAALGQVAQETQHLIAGLGHFGRQAQLGETAEPQEFCQFLTQVEDFFHDRAVVVLAGIRPLVRRPGAVRGVDFFTQRAVLGVGHHRVIAREFQGDQPAVQILGLSRGGHLRLGRIGQAGEGGFIGDVLGPHLSGIEQLVGETAAQFRQLALHFGVTFLFGFRQVDTRQTEVTQGVFQDSFLRHVETGGLRAAGQGFESLEQFAVLTHFSGIGAQGRQARLVGFTQFGAVAHGIEVADRAPGGAQTVVEFVHRQHQASPRWLFDLGLEDLDDSGTVVSQDLFNGRLYVFGADGGERRQVIGLQKRVVHAHG